MILTKERVLMYKLHYEVLLAGVFWVYEYVSGHLVLVNVSGSILCVSWVMSFGLCGCSLLCKTLCQIKWAPRMSDAMHLCILYLFYISFYYVSND
jgi:hypothetical protein